MEKNNSNFPVDSTNIMLDSQQRETRWTNASSLMHVFRLIAFELSDLLLYLYGF